MATDRKNIVRKPAVSAKSEAPQYLVKVESYIEGRLYQAGSTATYYGVPGANLRPLNAAAQANAKAAHEVRTDPGYQGDHPDETHRQRSEALRELDNDLQGIDPDTDNFDGEFGPDEPLPDAQRAELEKHALAAVEATKLAQEDDTNLVMLKLQGSTDPEDPRSKQGATPVLDGKGKK